MYGYCGVRACPHYQLDSYKMKTTGKSFLHHEFGNGRTEKLSKLESSLYLTIEEKRLSRVG